KYLCSGMGSPVPNELPLEIQPVEDARKSRENVSLVPPTILLRDLVAHVAALAFDRSDVSRKTWKTGPWQGTRRRCPGEGRKPYCAGTVISLPCDAQG